MTKHKRRRTPASERLSLRQISYRDTPEEIEELKREGREKWGNVNDYMRRLMANGRKGPFDIRTISDFIKRCEEVGKTTVEEQRKALEEAIDAWFMNKKSMR